MFQPTFDTTTEEQLGWDQTEFSDVLATLDAPPAAAGRGGGLSQLTQAPVWTQLTQPAAGRGTPAGGMTPAGRGTPAGGMTPAGGGTPDAAGSSQAAMATPAPNQLGPRVVRAPDPWTWTGARVVRPKRG
jgi:hypothetical protein